MAAISPSLRPPKQWITEGYQGERREFWALRSPPSYESGTRDGGADQNPRRSIHHGKVPSFSRSLLSSTKTGGSIEPSLLSKAFQAPLARSALESLGCTRNLGRPPLATEAYFNQ